MLSLDLFSGDWNLSMLLLSSHAANLNITVLPLDQTLALYFLKLNLFVFI